MFRAGSGDGGPYLYKQGGEGGMSKHPFPGFLLNGNANLLGDTPPTRVLVAMEFLAFLSAKQQTRAASNAYQIELIKGLPLTTAESNAQASACNLLNDYFHGKVKSSPSDKLQKEVVLDILDGNIASNQSSGKVIKCFACGFDQPPKANCIFCDGSGGLVVYSVVDRGNE
jgi:hypothetical protein